MREILFRGKRIDNGEWVYGNLNILNGCIYHIVPLQVYIHTSGIPDTEYYNVDPSTVGQYTGLTANGKKIFEGDIIHEKYDSSLPFGDGEKEYTIDRIAQIVFNEGSFECVIKGGGKDPVFLLCLDYTEVIGNIRDNPELLNLEAKA